MLFLRQPCTWKLLAIITLYYHQLATKYATKPCYSCREPCAWKLLAGVTLVLPTTKYHAILVGNPATPASSFQAQGSLHVLGSYTPAGVLS